VQDRLLALELRRRGQVCLKGQGCEDDIFIGTASQVRRVTRVVCVCMCVYVCVCVCVYVCMYVCVRVWM